MPRSGQAYPIDAAWIARVERRLKELDWTRADLAREIGAARSVVTNILAGKVKQSPYVPDIHLALGWSAPVASSVSSEFENLATVWAALDHEGRVRLMERALALQDAQKHPDSDPSKKR